MNVALLRAAIGKVRNRKLEPDSREATYLRTYPALLAMASCESVDDETRFLRLATIAYGWMPRIVRVNPQQLGNAIDSLRLARVATDGESCGEKLVAHVVMCLRSVVGASKVLHFANPEVFPIWDRKVERIRCGTKPSQHHMGQTRNYVSYALQVHRTRRAEAFPKFYEAFNQAYQERLDGLKIARYGLTEVRAIEAAAFELAGSGEDA